MVCAVSSYRQCIHTDVTLSGHKQAWEKARVLHRDLSLGNILILDERADDEDEYGFMHDLDYSAMEPIGADGVTIKDISNYDDNTAQHKERTVSDVFDLKPCLLWLTRWARGLTTSWPWTSSTPNVHHRMWYYTIRTMT